MSAQTPIWRAILWTERFLPAPWSYDAAIKAKPSRWRFAILPLISLSGVFTALLRHHGGVAEMWPAWRVQIEDFLLILAVAAAAAPCVAGVVTYRRERRNDA